MVKSIVGGSEGAIKNLLKGLPLSTELARTGNEKEYLYRKGRKKKKPEHDLALRGTSWRGGDILTQATKFREIRRTNARGCTWEEDRDSAGKGGSAQEFEE